MALIAGILLLAVKALVMLPETQKKLKLSAPRSQLSVMTLNYSQDNMFEVDILI